MQAELPAHTTEGFDLDQDSLVLVPELSLGQDLDQDPLALVPDPPGLDVAAHNFVGSSSSSTPGGDFPRHAGEDFETHTQVDPQFPCIEMNTLSANARSYTIL